MDLNIKIIDAKPQKKNNVLVVTGLIKIGDHKESFYMPLDWWSIEDYKRQWQEGIRRLKNNEQSCLVTSIHNPTIRPFIDWWLLYKIDNVVYVQNHMLISDIYKKQIGDKNFTTQTCYDFIPSRLKQEADDYRVSEWCVNYP